MEVRVGGEGRGAGDGDERAGYLSGELMGIGRVEKRAYSQWVMEGGMRGRARRKGRIISLTEVDLRLTL